MSADVVTSTKLFVMRYNITSLASARLLARDTQFKLSSMVVSSHTAASMVVALHEACRLSLHVLHRFDVFLCGRVPYRRGILHDWPDKRLIA